MIESISIKSVASYDTTGINITRLKKVNFIYGANGCGKTTISNLLHNPNDTKFHACSVNWENSQPLNTLVYNKEFREQNFGKGKISGVFTLGQATNEEIKIIDSKIEKLRIIKDGRSQTSETLKKQSQKLNDLEGEFKETCWTEIYKKYEPTFKEAFVGFLYKETFKNKLLQEFVGNAATLITLEELKTKAKTIFGKIPQDILPINPINYKKISDIIADTCWKKIIVGKADVDIAKFIQKLNISDWVNQGKNYLQNDEICPFCQQQTINNHFRKQLEEFFDESYLNNIEYLKNLKREYDTLTQNLINELNSIEITQKNLQNTKLDLDKYSACLRTLNSQNINNLELQKNKIKEPSSNIDLIPLNEQLDLIAELITNANIEIKKHNNIIANFKVEKNNLVKSIWKFIIEEFREKIIKFNTGKNGLTSGIQALETKLKAKQNELATLDTEIKHLSKNVTSIQPTINEINQLLKSFGFLNFEIKASSENGFYQIQREDGSIAEDTLSEGEITFITFLYYMQLANGGTTEESVNDERVLIIDDPVSSLDSNILFVVGTLIKETIKNVKSGNSNIKQIILLTHNVYFHKEVSFIDARTKICNKTNYWILRKNDRTSFIEDYKQTNPISTSYELLWKELKEHESNSGITLQNIMRRIIENYFKILGKYEYGDLIDQFNSKEEQDICRSLISWINDGSHGFPDPLFIEFADSQKNAYLNVFRDIFYKTSNQGHYNMMMSIN